jgi:hypothetical protein
MEKINGSEVNLADERGCECVCQCICACGIPENRLNNILQREQGFAADGRARGEVKVI